MPGRRARDKLEHASFVASTFSAFEFPPVRKPQAHSSSRISPHTLSLIKDELTSSSAASDAEESLRVFLSKKNLHDAFLAFDDASMAEQCS